MRPSSFSVGECVRDVSTFPKSVRLRKRADFVALQNATCKQTVKGFLIVWQSNDRDAPRLGITASKKIGCAVIRNRIKRFTREVFRHRRSLLPQVDINVIARRESASMDFCSVQRELEKAFSRIGASPCLRAVCS
ncbi:MAG: ribonuclease P protein component [Desulfuromonadales bacterium]|nr:ribonuclease P protein component [Desulfuromonadales bacterium]